MNTLEHYPNRVLTANFVILVLAVLDTGHVHGSLVGENLASLDEVAVTSVEDGVQHALVEKEVTHPLRNDNVDLGERQLNLLHLSLEKCNLVGQAVDSDDLAGLLNDGRHIDTDYVLGTGLRSEPEKLVRLRTRRCEYGGE